MGLDIIGQGGNWMMRTMAMVTTPKMATATIATHGDDDSGDGRASPGGVIVRRVGDTGYQIEGLQDNLMFE